MESEFRYTAQKDALEEEVLTRMREANRDWDREKASLEWRLRHEGNQARARIMWLDSKATALEARLNA